MSIRIQHLKERADAAGKAARGVAVKAERENRPMTGDERAVYDGSMTELQACLDGIKAIKADEALTDQARAFANEVGMPGSGDTRGNGQRLHFGAKTAEKLAAKMLTGDQFGQKAVAPSGAAVVGVELAADPVAMGKPALSLLDVLALNPAHTSPKFAYLRQNARTTLAAVVPEGTVKPTSVYSLERIDAELAVVAHLSEALPRYWLVDNLNIQQWLTNELEYGLSVAVEKQALTAIHAASGIQTQAYATSPLTTLRKSLTALETQGLQPLAFVMTAVDWESVELMLTTAGAVETRGVPYDAAARKLFGVPVVTSLAATTGVATTLSVDAAKLNVDSNGVEIAWSETSNADDFSKNLIRARLEGRFATSVERPIGIVKSTLSAAAALK